MSIPHKDWLAKWLPLLVAVVTNLMIVAYSYGKLEQRLAPIELQLANLAHDRLSSSFVMRPEFEMRTAQRDREMETQAEWLKRIEAKLDRLLERQAGKE